MLVEKNKLVGEHVVIKLVTGEEVLGKLKDNKNSDVIILNKPKVLTLHENQMILIPYMQLSNDEDIDFSPTSIIAIARMGTEIKNEYTRITSNLVMTNKMPDMSKFQL